MRKPLWIAGATVVVPLAIFAACADSGDENVVPSPDGGQPDSGTPDVNIPSDARDVDAQALRCSEDFCLVDLPNAAAYGFTDWIFAGVRADPTLGAWAIANGVYGTDQATAQLLRFENDTWVPVHAPALGDGAGKRSIELYSITFEAPGRLIAVGATLDDATPVVVRGDGTTFTTSVFSKSLNSVWSNNQGETWAAGNDGGIFRSDKDGGWKQDTTAGKGDFEAIWGNSADDLYVGGVTMVDEFSAAGYVGHRTVSEAGAPKWTFQRVPDDMFMVWSDPHVLSGVVAPEGARFWASLRGLARVTPKAGGGDEWSVDPYQPRAAIRAFLARSKDEIWAVGHVGRIARFDGTAWKDTRMVFNEAPLTAHLFAIAATSAGEIHVVGAGVALRKKAQ